LTVRGGSAAPQLPAGAPGAPGHGPVVVRNLVDAISAFEGGEKNTDVVVELVSGALRPPLPSTGPPRTSARWTTAWVLNGKFMTPIMIGRGGH